MTFLLDHQADGNGDSTVRPLGEDGVTLNVGRSEAGSLGRSWRLSQLGPVGSAPQKMHGSFHKHAWPQPVIDLTPNGRRAVGDRKGEGGHHTYSQHLPQGHRHRVKWPRPWRLGLGAEDEPKLVPHACDEQHASGTTPGGISLKTCSRDVAKRDSAACPGTVCLARLKSPRRSHCCASHMSSQKPRM